MLVTSLCGSLPVPVPGRDENTKTDREAGAGQPPDAPTFRIERLVAAVVKDGLPATGWRQSATKGIYSRRNSGANSGAAGRQALFRGPNWNQGTPGSSSCVLGLTAQRA